MTTEEHLTDCTHDLIMMVKYAKQVGDAQHIRNLRDILSSAITDLDEMKRPEDARIHSRNY